MAGLILIAGAGPVGLTMAVALKRQGVDVRIVDKALARTSQSKALVLWPRTLELLDIQGGSGAFVAAGTPARGARILVDGQTVIHFDFATARSAYRYALMIPQSETERLLELSLEAAGLTVERGTTLVSFEEGADGVRTVLRHLDGREEELRADWLIGCDGAHSTVRHGLASATFEGDTLPSEWLLADLQINGDLPGDEISTYFSSEGVTVFFPIEGSRFRVVANVGLTADADTSDPTLEQIQALLEQRGFHWVAHDPVWMSRFRINERKVQNYRQGRVFLAGDAAHVHSPAGGQGMNTGMQDAINLSWKLAMVWRGVATPALLDSYSPERSAIGQQVLRNAGVMTRVGLATNPLLRKLLSLAGRAISHIPALLQKQVDQFTEINLGYPSSPLTSSPDGAALHPAGGERAPDTPLTVDGFASLYAALGTGRFIVLSVGGQLVELAPPLAALATALRVDAALGYDAGHVYLIRPDAYVALSTPATDTHALIKALEEIAGR